MQWVTASYSVPDKPFLNLKEVSVAVGYSTRQIRRWIEEGEFPEPCPVSGGGKKWAAESVGAWKLWQQHRPKGAISKIEDGDDDETEPPKGEKKRT